MENPLREGLGQLCALWFRGEETIRVCVEMLLELAEKGYTSSGWGQGLRWHVAEKLRRLGIVMKKTVPDCHSDTFHRVYVVDRKRFTRIRLALEALDKPWPMCMG